MPGITRSDLRRAEGIASFFRIPRPVRALEFKDRGNMSHEMYLVVAGPSNSTSEYLLQRMNNTVFTNPHGVVEAMQACTAAQRRYLEEHPLPPDTRWDTVELVPAAHGGPILELMDEESVSFWRMMVRIGNSVCYKSLQDVPDRARQIFIAEQAGRGLALFGDLTSGIDVSSLSNPLPGYRDTRVYYAQLDSIMRGSRCLEQAMPFLPEDADVRESTQFHFLVHLDEEAYRQRLNEPDLQGFIDIALENREYALTLLRLTDRGTIRTVAIHGDTKLDNFLFDADTGAVRALVDLDTIMPHTWLADWGDMARSLVNVVGEKEPDLDRVRVDVEVFHALARGFLSTAREVTDTEIELMVDAVQILALELGVRFLTDYIRGDSYFKIGPEDPPDLNKTRAKVQLMLFKRLADHAPAMRDCIEECVARRKEGHQTQGECHELS
jgi:hypothetical protein